MSQPTYVVGHQQPDTDSITAAISYARLKQQQGRNAVAARAGEINPETAFVLDRWAREPPAHLESGRDKQLILVDHNEYSQAVEGANAATVTEVLDHHRIGDLTTSEPIHFYTEPVGSTATLVFEQYAAADVELDSQTAGLLLSGLLSDTVVCRSPTTTEKDRVAAEELAAIAGVEQEAYGKELLAEKSKLGEKSPREMVVADFKAFEFGDSHVGIGQIETVDPDQVLSQQAAVLAAMDELVEERGFDLLVLLVTDLLAEESTALLAGSKTDVVAAAFETTINDRTVSLSGVMSRKKQVVPPLEKALTAE